MIYTDVSGPCLLKSSKELLGGARSIADGLREELTCVLVGEVLGETPREAIACGVDRVLVVNGASFKDMQVDMAIQIMEQALKIYPPRIILMQQSDVDLACRLAFKLKVGLVSDCTALELDPNTKLLKMIRSIYGGKARATYTSVELPQLATIRSKTFEAPIEDNSRQGETVALEMRLGTTSVKTKVVERVREDSGVRVEDAAVIVCGGRGLGGPQPFETVLKELADVLRGVVGASRPPADNGWVPKALHIGLTGKIVAPDLYVAIAVSGASQHMAGCSRAKTLVAINRDFEANIFREANYGVVGSYEEVVPAFTEKLRTLLG